MLRTWGEDWDRSKEKEQRASIGEHKHCRFEWNCSMYLCSSSRIGALIWIFTSIQNKHKAWNKDGRKPYFFFFFRKALWFLSSIRSKHIKFKKSSHITVLPAVVLSQCFQIFSGSYHNVSKVLTVSYKHNVWSIPSSLKQTAVCIKNKKIPNFKTFFILLDNMLR